MFAWARRLGAGNAQYNFLRHALRGAQICVVSYSLFQAGYSNGLMTFAANPRKVEQLLVDNTVNGKLQDESAEKVLAPNSSEYRRVEKVASRIVIAAQEHCKAQIRKYNEELDAAISQQDVLATAPTSSLAPSVQTSFPRNVIDIQKDIDQWTESYANVQGRWDFIVINTDSPNAFVTALCPKKIFVHVGLLKVFDPDEDELGMVLGHEMSHVILSHGTRQLDRGFISSLVQLMFLSFIDPSGVISLFLETLSFEARKLYQASYSRECEAEADALGIQIASRACFNVYKGAHIFKKFAETDQHHETHWHDSHPSSDDRFDILIKASETYTGVHGSEECAMWRERFEKAKRGYFGRWFG